MWPAPEVWCRRLRARLSRIVKLECWDLHLHLGRSRDGASFFLPQVRKTLNEHQISRAVLFAIDEVDAGPTYERSNDRVLKASASDSRLIPFARLSPRTGNRAVAELHRSIHSGARGVKLHPRSEKFSSQEAEPLINEVEAEGLPVFLHTSHEKNCGPREWEKIFKRHRRTSFVLFHGGKDSYEKTITVAARNRNVWVETSTLSYWRSGLILRRLGASKVVFGSDLPYSHPAVERLKLDFLLNRSERKIVYSDNPKRILGE